MNPFYKDYPYSSMEKDHCLLMIRAAFSSMAGSQYYVWSSSHRPYEGYYEHS